MLKTFTCIICPNGCQITVNFEDKKVHTIQGATCRRGEDYVRQEILDPRRTIASSVLVRGGELPLASVRLTKPIPKDRIMEAMGVIRSISLEAPVEAGTVLISGILGTDSDLIATKTVGRKHDT